MAEGHAGVFIQSVLANRNQQPSPILNRAGDNLIEVVKIVQILFLEFFFGFVPYARVDVKILHLYQTTS